MMTLGLQCQTRLYIQCDYDCIQVDCTTLLHSTTGQDYHYSIASLSTPFIFQAQFLVVIVLLCITTIVKGFATHTMMRHAVPM